MRYKRIDIKYWTLPNGQDFEDFNEYVNNINQEYYLSINKLRTDTCGGGIYDLIIKLTEDITFLELSQSYVQDGVKVIVGLSIKPLIDATKKLFKKNKSLNPSIDKIEINYKDVSIHFYNVYNKAIDECLDDVMKELFALSQSHKKLFKKAESIHIPIINQPDAQNICNYRVKLDLDETKQEFNRQDIFTYWGIKTKGKDRVYSLETKSTEKKKFYILKEYRKLRNKKKPLTR